MNSLCDQTGYEILLPVSPPQRIISLVPSQTELLFDLGLEHQIVGVTRFCVHPSDAKTKSIIGGTKKFDFDAIAALRPDLIIANKEENYQDGILYLRERYPVWTSDIFDLEDALSMIRAIGQLTLTQQKGEEMITAIQDGFQQFTLLPSRRTLYLIWKKPWMAAGPQTFIDAMMQTAGLVNSIRLTRYPQLFDEDIRQLTPELILLSSEPYPFQEKHIQELRTLAPEAQIVLVDGEMFSWYGSRLLKTPDYFDGLSKLLR